MEHIKGYVVFKESLNTENINEGKGQALADKYVAKLRQEFKKLNDDELSEFRATIAQAFDLNESVNEAEFKHINKSEHKIKLAIKDVEKKSRLKINRDKEPEYEQLSLNKIMLSKVLGRERLGKEHQAAWEKLKKEYELKESVNEGVFTIVVGTVLGLIAIKTILKKVLGDIGIRVKLPKDKLHKVLDAMRSAAIEKMPSGEDKLLSLFDALGKDIDGGSIKTTKDLLDSLEQIEKSAKSLGLSESVNEGSTYRVYMNSDPDEPKRIDYERYFGDGTKAEMIKQAKKMVKSKTNQYGDPILVTVTGEDDIDDVAWTNESVNEATDINDPFLVKVRVMRQAVKDRKEFDAWRKANPLPRVRKISFDKYLSLRETQVSYIEDLKELTSRLKEMDSDMEAEAGQKGDGWTDDDGNKYGGLLMALEDKYSKIQSKLLKITAKIDKYNLQ